MAQLVRDLRLGLRTLLRRRGSSLLTLLVLALGIGFSTAMFSVLDGVLLRGLPFPDGDRIVTVATMTGHDRPMPARDFLRLRESQENGECEIFGEVAAFRVYNGVVTQDTAQGGVAQGRTASKGLTVSYVTGNLFRMLGAEPLMGRSFTPDDEARGADVAILSHKLWQRQFGGDPDVLGREILLNREKKTIIGVMPEGFLFPIRQEVWTVIAWDGKFGDQGVFGIAKLRPDSSAPLAERQLASLVTGLDEENPFPEARQAYVRHYTESYLSPELQRALKGMLWAVLGVLLIACANAANLRLGEALRRRGELTVRRALGASHGQLVGLLVSEALVLAAAAAAAGLAFAVVLVRLADRVLLQGSMLVRFFWIDVRLDARSIVFAVAMTLVAVVLGGLLPAFWSLGRDQLRMEKRSTASRGTLRLTTGIVVAEVAVCFTLLCGSGLLVRSGLALVGGGPNFDTTHLMRLNVQTYQAGYENAEEQRQFWQDFLARLEAVPEIRGATLTTMMPWMSGPSHGLHLETGGDPARDADEENVPMVAGFTVLPGYLEMLGLPLRTGRGLTWGDETVSEDSSERSVNGVVSESFARRHLGGEPLGQTFELVSRWGDRTPLRVHVVGVSADIGLSYRGRPDDAEAVYMPYDNTMGGFLLVRGRDGTAGLTTLVDGELARLNPLVATLDDMSYADERAEQIWIERRMAQLFTFFAAGALVLCAVGLFGVIALSVERRTKEIAIRSAIGALPRELRALLLREGARCVGAGLALGALLVAWMNAFLESFLYGVRTWDPAVMVLALALVSAVLLAAILGPARRVGRIDPIAVLRGE